jgi:hypothetical protein
MADAGLFIGFGQPVRGREGQALDSFNETVQFLGELQGNGRIEDFEICFLEPHGGDLGGYILLRGDAGQISAVQEDGQFRRHMQRADLVVERLGVVRALLGEAIGREMAAYQEEIGALA